MTMYGPTSAFIVIGARDLSPDTFVLNDDVEYLTEEVHPIGSTGNWEKNLPIGTARVKLEASGGLYDDRVGGIIDALQANTAVSQRICYGMSGQAFGSEAVALEGAIGAKFKRIISRDGLTKANAEYTVTGSHRRGRLAHGFSTETTDPGNNEGSAAANDSNSFSVQRVGPITNATVANPTVLTAPAHGLVTGDVVMIAGSTTTPTIDGQRTVTVVDANSFTVPVNVTSGGGAQTATFKKLTSTGARADLHVLSLVLGGFTNIIIKLRHSTDGITYADYVTFAAATSAPFVDQQISGSVLNRYTAVSWDFTGAGAAQSCLFIVVFSRDN